MNENDFGRRRYRFVGEKLFSVLSNIVKRCSLRIKLVVNIVLLLYYIY